MNKRAGENLVVNNPDNRVFMSRNYRSDSCSLEFWCPWSGTMIKILPHDFLGLSHRIPRKNKNVVYLLQISALVPEIFVFEKYVKYANEMTDDVIYSTQYYMKFIICLAPWAGKMNRISRCDWLPERARWSYLARSGYGLCPASIIYYVLVSYPI